MRKLIFWIHLLLGVAAGAVVFIMSLTGVLLAYEKEVTHWADERTFAPAQAGAPAMQLTQLYAAVLQQQHGTPTGLTIYADASRPAEVSFGRERMIFIDRSTGKVLGEGATKMRAFFRRTKELHRWLALKGASRETGRRITGACNLAFLGLLVTGAYLWIPRFWTGQTVRSGLRFRRGLPARARELNWHKTLGVWTLVPLAIVIVSGVVMSYGWANNLVFRMTGSEPPKQQQGEQGRQRGGPAVPSSAPELNLDPIYSAAEQQSPRWKSISGRIPAYASEPVSFSVDEGDGGRPDKRKQVTVSPNGKVLRTEVFGSYSAGRRWRAWLRFLHTGEAGGFVGKFIGLITSAAACVLVYTGIAMSIRRLLRATKKTKPQTEKSREPAIA